MKKILVTGGTTFVSKYAAEYFVNMGYEVYVLNRNTKSQVRGVKLIEGDRHNLNGILKNLSFDVVADITAYNEKDIIDFVKELGSYGQYIMISSSAVDSELMLWRMPPAAAVHRIADSDTASPCRQVRSAITARSHVP